MDCIVDPPSVRVHHERKTPIDLVQFVWLLVREKNPTVQDLFLEFKEKARLDDDEAERYIKDIMDHNMIKVAGCPKRYNDLPKIMNKTVYLPELEDITFPDFMYDFYCYDCHKQGDVLKCDGCYRVFHEDCAMTDVEKQDDLKQYFVKENHNIAAMKIIRDFAGALFLDDTIKSGLDCYSYCYACRLSQIIKKSEPKLSQEHLNNFMNFMLNAYSSWLPSDTYSHSKLFRNEKVNEIVKNMNYCMKFLLINPKTMKDIFNKIDQSEYHSFSEFQIDIMDIAHNLAVIYGLHSVEYTAGMYLFKDIRYDISEISLCTDCYRASNEKKNNWFIQPCTKDHKLVFAKHDTWPFWPAKVMRIVNDMYDVRFFGTNHSRAVVNASNIKSIDSTLSRISNPKKLKEFRDAMRQLEKHKQLLEDDGRDYTTVKLSKSKARSPNDYKLMEFSIVLIDIVKSEPPETLSEYNYSDSDQNDDYEYDDSIFNKTVDSANGVEIIVHDDPITSFDDDSIIPNTCSETAKIAAKPKYTKIKENGTTKYSFIEQDHCAESSIMAVSSANSPVNPVVEIDTEDFDITTSSISDFNSSAIVVPKILSVHENVNINSDIMKMRKMTSRFTPVVKKEKINTDESGFFDAGLSFRSDIMNDFLETKPMKNNEINDFKEVKPKMENDILPIKTGELIYVDDNNPSAGSYMCMVIPSPPSSCVDIGFETMPLPFDLLDDYDMKLKVENEMTPIKLENIVQATIKEEKITAKKKAKKTKEKKRLASSEIAPSAKRRPFATDKVKMENDARVSCYDNDTDKDFDDLSSDIPMRIPKSDYLKNIENQLMTETDLEQLRQNALMALQEHNNEWKKEFVFFHKEFTNLISESMKLHWCRVCRKSSIMVCCLHTSYCSIKCQELDWITHKDIHFG